MIVLGWVLISALFCRCNYLSKKLAVAENNIVSLNNELQDQAIAYQIDFDNYCITNDSLAEALEISKRTKQIVRVKEVVSTTDTLTIDLHNTIVAVKTIKVDTTLTNDWRTLRIEIHPDSSNEGCLRLSDSVSVSGWLSYRVDEEKVPRRKYRTWVGRLWGKMFHCVKVSKVYVRSDNPLICIDSTNYIQIVH